MNEKSHSQPNLTLKVSDNISFEKTDIAELPLKSENNRDIALNAQIIPLVDYLIDSKQLVLDPPDLSEFLSAAVTGDSKIVADLLNKGFDSKLTSGAAETKFQDKKTFNLTSSGYHDVLILLLQAKADITFKSTLKSELFAAVKKGNLRATKFLIESEPWLINSKDEYNNSPLDFAVVNGDASAVSYLIRKKITITLSPKFIAVFFGKVISGHFDIVKMLIKAKPSLLEQTDLFNHTPLLLAATEGHKVIVSYLIKMGANPNVWTHSPGGKNHGKTALDWALDKNHIDIAVLLYQNGATTNYNHDPSKIVKLFFPIIIKACAEVRSTARLLAQGTGDNESSFADFPLEVGELIASFVADKTILSHKDALLISSDNFNKPNCDRNISQQFFSLNPTRYLESFTREGQRGIVGVLLRNLPPKDMQANLNSSLRIAVRAQILTIVKFLLDMGADGNTIDLYNDLHLPSLKMTEEKKQTQLRIISLLIQYGTACSDLHDAIAQGNVDTVELLLSYIKNVKSLSGSPNLLISAIQRGSLKLVKLLLESGADVNSINENGVNALIHAIVYQQDQIAEELINWGADILVQVPESVACIEAGDNALDLAIRLNKKEIAKKLIDRLSSKKIFLLRNSVLTEKFETAKFLLEFNILDINDRGSNGETALLLAVSRQLEDFVGLLLSHHADYQIPALSDCESLLYTKGETALNVVVRQKNPKIIELFINSGVNIPEEDTWELVDPDDTNCKTSTRVPLKLSLQRNAIQLYGFLRSPLAILKHHQEDSAGLNKKI